MNRKLVFIHMPKCAGTSLRHALSEALDDECCNTVRVETVPTVLAAEAAEMEVQAFREQILLYFMANPQYRFISGHFSFSELAFRRFSDDWSFITLLRHPVERWLSHYFFNRFKENSHTAITMELEEFLLTDRAHEFGSEYVRRLCQPAGTPGVDNRDNISLALANLDQLALAGIVEELDVFCINFEKMFGLKIEMDQINRNPASRKLRAALEDKTLCRRIEELCRPDMQIYEHAKKRNNLLHCGSTSNR